MDSQEKLEIDNLKSLLRIFAAERDWDQFHSPKNLAMALSVESSEILEHFQWLTEEEASQLSIQKKELVSEELADVLLYLIRLADKLDVDLIQSAYRKLEVNEKKYPVNLVKGKAEKYTEYLKDDKQ